MPVGGDPIGGSCQDTIVAVEEYSRVVASLRHAYGPAAAAERDGREKEAFKVDERRRFLDLLRNRGATSLLEVGAGTGHDSLYFQGQGLRVLCTDLSPAMVGLCRAKGLDAQVADFLGLGVSPASFDAVYAMNCLLHVPTPIWRASWRRSVKCWSRAGCSMRGPGAAWTRRGRCGTTAIRCPASSRSARTGG